MEITITPQMIRAQVGRILASESFVRSRRMQRFLEFIVEETLAGRADQLGEYAIGTAVFDRGSDFEPAGDPIVRNDARRLRLKLLEYYCQGHPRPADHVLIDVPKGSYVPVFLAVSSRDGWEMPAAGFAHRVAVLPLEVLSAAPHGAMYGRARLTPAIGEGGAPSGATVRFLSHLVPVPADIQTWAHEFYFETYPSQGRRSDSASRFGARQEYV
jgi:hypothetical protein